MKTSAGLRWKDGLGQDVNDDIEFDANSAILIRRLVAANSVQTTALKAAGGKNQLVGFNGPYARLYDIVDSITEDGDGIPTEASVAKYVKSSSKLVSSGAYICREEGIYFLNAFVSPTAGDQTVIYKGVKQDGSIISTPLEKRSSAIITLANGAIYIIAFPSYPSLTPTVSIWKGTVPQVQSKNPYVGFMVNKGRLYKLD